jgi:cytochrome b
VVAFTLNYFIMEAGGDLHQIIGYTAIAAVAVRLLWAFVSKGYSSFNTLVLTRTQFAQHFEHIKHRNIPADSGHNPIGWLMVLATWALFIGLGTTGFMMEEIDMFFGNSQLEDIHSIFSNVLYGIVIVHILALVLVGWWGKVALIRAMITGKRKV